MTPARDTSVFINCPFDPQFAHLLDALTFAVLSCGFAVRNALEVRDSGEARLTKIVRLIEQSRFSLHDISRVELDPASGLPRFNMPIELGIAISMKHLGRDALRDYALLVLDVERFRYRTFASDLAGADIAAHGGRVEGVIAEARGFLATHAARPLPGAQSIADTLALFAATLPALAAAAGQGAGELTYIDRLRHMTDFLGSVP